MNNKELDKEIELVLEEMHQLDPASDAYDKAIRQLERLTNLNHEKTPWYKDPEILKTVIGVGGNFALAILVLNFEKTDSIVSKAWNLVGRRLI